MQPVTSSLTLSQANHRRDRETDPMPARHVGSMSANEIAMCETYKSRVFETSEEIMREIQKDTVDRGRVRQLIHQFREHTDRFKPCEEWLRETDVYNSNRLPVVKKAIDNLEERLNDTQFSGLREFGESVLRSLSNIRLPTLPPIPKIPGLSPMRD